MSRDHILVQGARQNNLKGLNLKLPLGELIVVTGVSGSGKSSLAFDTIYSEGQRRYVETFSPYARQFLDRMDKPQVERIEGIPPAIAIDQTNPVRTSRSTVGTMTELNDHLKLLFARAAHLYCRGCAQRVRRDTSQSIYAALVKRPPAGTPDDTRGARALIVFPVTVPENFSEQEVKEALTQQGYARIHRTEGPTVEVIQDRVRLQTRARERIVEALEAALRHGHGSVVVYPLDADGNAGTPWRFSTNLHCPDCNIHYSDPLPSLFSFNSPIGACDTCRGFGRTMGIDFERVVPDASKTLAQGAVKPWQSESYGQCQKDLVRFARRREVPTDVAWHKLTKQQRRWVLEGEGDWEEGAWYGVRRFFDWLETKSYKMHIRVLLSKYRSYDLCPDCHGARLKPQALVWRLGSLSDADGVLARDRRLTPPGTPLSGARQAELPGLTVADAMGLSLVRCRAFFDELRLAAPLDEATELVLGEIRTRLKYLVEVGLGYLTLDRQSRTLSGGEVQRVNLTTALGTSLVNTLFVLDEPSIGLHTRDMGRVIEVLRRLRDAGNSLLVVEHDPQVMRAADRILDLGPGPGERGGRKVFFGPPTELEQSKRSLTARYLRGEKAVDAGAGRAPQESPEAWLEILGAAEHNLKNIDVRVPLQRLVCVTGVSGSGKSTLVHEVCYNAVRKAKGKPKAPPGRHRALRGHEQVNAVTMVDQSPIGKTTRSNPASYVGVLDAIRKAFAAEPLARERGYTAATFSFNSDRGRCPTCGGSGFEHVEMQFLSDVYLRCPDCDGRRYRHEVLEVKLLPSTDGDGQPKSIAGVLEMTAREALGFFAAQADVVRALEPLVAVGLDYMKLGQPVPTLSGGEAQRLKLAGHLAKAHGKSGADAGTLFLFDEPTTGLHFDDIAKLLGAFRQLLSQGHSLVVIEHNLEIVAAADWIVDLGPEGGEAGGEVVATGTPAEVAECESSHTGAALRRHFLHPRPNPAPSKEKGAAATSRGRKSGLTPSRSAGEGGDGEYKNHAITMHHAREHNLKDIDLRIPRDRFTVITGVSGSGKSTVAFDILFAEGQRRYLESLNAYARQFVQPAARPDVDAVVGIPPTVAIEQRTSRGGYKSTVATMTEIYHFLRLLFVKLGVQYCPDCDTPIEAQTRAAMQAQIVRSFRGRRIRLLAPMVVARKGYYTDLAEWAAGKGFSHLRVDGQLTPTQPWPRLDRFSEHDIELPVGEVTAAPREEAALRDLLERALELGGGTLIAAPAPTRGAGSRSNERVFSTKRACPRCGRSFAELDPRLFSYNSKHGWCERCHGTGLARDDLNEDASAELQAEADTACPACNGQRLRPEALAVRFQESSIAELTALSVAAAKRFFQDLRLSGRALEIARDSLAELRARLRFLENVGLAYLALERAAPTLSGGEAQRIRLAAQLGSNLRGVCYILDEPTIGLHARDNRMLLKTLKGLENKGNTVVVVEHDEETIRQAEHIVDLGPGAGVNGGHLVAEGSADELMANPQSVTGQYLAKPLRHPLVETGRVDADHAEHWLEIAGARLHNLKDLQLGLPLNRLLCVTGVSGSGKSTLVRGVLHNNLQRLVAGQRTRKGRKSRVALSGCQTLAGWGEIRRVLEVDQTPIGKTPRSCPATYVGLWDGVRRLFAETSEARLRGYGPGRFSFNVRGGRCEACAGQGVKKVEMSFLPDVRVLCEVCEGARFSAETLTVRFKDKSVADVLAMSVDEARPFFSAHRSIHHALRLLQDVGLGYLTLGQQSPTLSGGEAQRIKLVTELAKARPELGDGASSEDGALRATTSAPALYVLDEPTIGLHAADVEKLVRVLHALVSAGNTVVVIEHNLDIVAEADWVVDLGPEGGDGGGQLVGEGPPKRLARVKGGSHTARALARFLKERSVRQPDKSV